MRASEFINDSVDKRIKKDNQVLSWHSLDEGLCLSDKISIFEEYHINGNLTKSLDEDKTNYFMSIFAVQQGVAESIEHNVDDLSDVADWMRTTPDKLKMVVKQEPIEKFIKQIREMYGTYDEFPEDEERTNRILKLLKKGSKPLPMYVEDGDPDLFVMEGRHRMVAFWLAGMKTIPVAYVSVKKQGVAEGLSWKSLDAGLSLDNKMAIFEEYHTKGNLFESVDEDKKSYFVSLFDMSSIPEKNKRYIVVPLLLIGNKILPLDKPDIMEYLGKDNGQLVFKYKNKEIKYPSKTMRDLSLFYTFTFLNNDTYDKFRMALSLKFDVDLPEVNSRINEGQDLPTSAKYKTDAGGIQLDVSIDGSTVDIRAMAMGRQLGYVVFDRDGGTLVADDLVIDERFRGQGIASIMYDHAKDIGFTIKRSNEQTDAGRKFWDKYKPYQTVWEENNRLFIEN